MASGLHFDLRLEERSAEGALVSVVLEPRRGPVTLDGVSLQILGPGSQPVSARMLLPIAGQLAQTMVSTMELRALEGELPPGARVVGLAWGDDENLEASIPTDPYTELEGHLRARRRVEPVRAERQLTPLTPLEDEALAAVFPWLREPRLPRAAAQLEVVDSEQDEEAALDGLLDELGVDEASAEWLKELMDED